MLSVATHALTTEMTVALSELDMTPRAFAVLTSALEGERTQKQLAEQCGLDKTTMVVTIDELERTGLAERRPSPSDRRARIITVTKAGQKAVAEADKIAARLQAEVLATLPPRDRDAFVRALEQLVNGRLAEPVACDRIVRRPRAS
jgi:MarR family transcriptional regulator for hemolysin